LTERAAALLRWYDAVHRDLPWRHTTDPYLILVSEVMLQQTQASRVVPYYERFIARYPAAEDLAAAPLGEVLALWQGLGYPSRAKRLREAARTIAAEGWPDDLEALPGVGPYTAAAVASFAFGRAVAVVDTNVRRVVSRWRGVPLDGSTLADAATEELTDPADTWNQAMMELGATVCRPSSPDCAVCPVSEWCADPSVYVPTPRQPAYRGSDREARGKILAVLVERGSVPSDSITEHTGIDRDRIETIVTGLVHDGLIEHQGERISLPG
jgi:A/G-specific adenine glycosylase